VIESLTLLCHGSKAQKALRKIFQTLFASHTFYIPHLPEISPEINEKEFLISESMKLACIGNRRVFVFGVDLKDTIEKKISCKRFSSYVSFLPLPFILTDLLIPELLEKPDGDLLCEKQCTVFGGRKTYAGQMIDKICHTFSHIPGNIEYTDADLKKFLSIVPNIKILENLFVPKYNEESDLVRSFLSRIKRIGVIAQSGNLTIFKHEFDRFYDDELFNEFPYLGE